jgi:hypothetical protein
MKDLEDKVLRLVEDYRARCLWFMRKDFVPRTPDEILQVLDLIERNGDRAAYLRAEEIKRWLSQNSKVTSLEC